MKRNTRKSRAGNGEEAKRARRLSGPERKRQLLDTALRIVREEGADRLTLGYLASRAGVSKPVAYDHFGTRSKLLIELYRLIDRRQSDALRETLTTEGRSFEETASLLAAAHVHCHADTSGEWHAIGAALAGSEEKEAVYQELLDGYVQLFATVLRPYFALEDTELERRCVGLIGAGDALSAAMVRGHCSEADAAKTFALLIRGGLREMP
ncbi:TetR/AcrR family transcriptional regulator [Aidingimonas halophila]|uniref:Transcriptional regulator, TetR family n=1 Tax=Aidingimonas halophila TaxID=574349 RepID=A0A1H2V0X2_9GAMM|nr:TetR/AcrR family transcriptional regulator [Aidingimonas halophila]GHC23514.1 TetR family transcriptional regulator [Aidingimonas halophila]SDW61951.1 transcriptional regulator, TetR family [Aidingimonas halophila]